MLSVLRAAVEHARSGRGPFLVEAHTYRMEAHTNADDATRYRDDAEVVGWSGKDPVVRLERYLRSVGALDDAAVQSIAAAAESFAADVRERLNADVDVEPMELFEHVYATPTSQLEEQREQVAAELEAEADIDGGTSSPEQAEER